MVVGAFAQLCSRLRPSSPPAGFASARARGPLVLGMATTTSLNGDVEDGGKLLKKDEEVDLLADGF